MSVARKKRGNVHRQFRLEAKQGCISYNMHSSVHGRRLEVIPSKRANGAVLVRCKVEEVDVLGTFIVEVVVLVS